MAGRRMGPPDATIRFRLLDAAERVLARDGYPALTSRKVGQEAGVDQKLVFYYFQNMEALILATFQRRSEAFLSALEGLADAAAPLTALWSLSSDRDGRVIIEFMAMAPHNAALRQAVADHSQRANALIEAMLARRPPPQCPGTPGLTPAFINFAIAALARNVMLERALDLRDGQAQIEQTIAHWLQTLDHGP